MPSLAPKTIFERGDRPALDGEYEINPKYYEIPKSRKADSDKVPRTYAVLEFQDLNKPKATPLEVYMEVAFAEDFAPSEDGEEKAKGKGDIGPRGTRLALANPDLQYDSLNANGDFGMFLKSLGTVLNPDTDEKLSEDSTADLTALAGFRVSMYHEYKKYISKKTGKEETRKSPTNLVRKILWDPYAKEGSRPPSGTGASEKSDKSGKDEDGGKSEKSSSTKKNAGADEDTLVAIIDAAIESVPENRKDLVEAIKKADGYDDLASPVKLKLVNSAKKPGGQYEDVIVARLAEAGMEIDDEGNIAAA